MDIRTLEKADAEGFQRLRLRALKEHPEAFAQSYESQRATSLEAVAERLDSTARSQDGFILGGYVDDELVGMIGFRRVEGHKAGHNGLIWGMYVVSEMQGRGYGRRLLSEALDRARAVAGLEQVLLTVTIAGRRAREVYQSAGFESWGVLKRAMLVDERYLDEESMVLRL